ncbi:DUF4862 family protein [Arthrobacter sp. NPDC080031]|uniref:DUF4862 family protein n=1 Tax=Arthrobacter sp. NPDC080031 TaxID=3155918 RepID=UPI00344E44A5
MTGSRNGTRSRDDGPAGPPGGLIVGAYATSPYRNDWHPEFESRLFDLLSAMPGLRGLEIPWFGSLHQFDDNWLLTHLRPHWDLVLNDIGSGLRGVAADSTYGLASRDRLGRMSALKMAARLRDDVDRLNQAAGRQAVIAVEFHSPPPRMSSSEALAESLARIQSWDWGETSLLVEHCDALVAGHPPAFGYLSLTDELSAVISSGTDFGISINWGRSAIELRDPDRVLEHIAEARSAGLLRSIVFSGAASQDTEFGPSWVDAHLPPAASNTNKFGEPASLLTPGRMKSVLDTSGQLDWIGLKIAARPVDLPLAGRIQLLSDSIRLVNEARASASV